MAESRDWHGLGVVHRNQTDLDLEEFIERFPHSRGELWSTIRYNVLCYAKVPKHMKVACEGEWDSRLWRTGRWPPGWWFPCDGVIVDSWIWFCHFLFMKSHETGEIISAGFRMGCAISLFLSWEWIQDSLPAFTFLEAGWYVTEKLNHGEKKKKKKQSPLGLSWVELLGSLNLFQVLVISQDHEQMLCSFQLAPPFLKRCLQTPY